MYTYQSCQQINLNLPSNKHRHAKTQIQTQTYAYISSRSEIPEEFPPEGDYAHTHTHTHTYTDKSPRSENHLPPWQSSGTYLPPKRGRWDRNTPTKRS